MEVATATPTNGGVPPFHDHDVREWSTLDSLTGVLERARIETDHWAASTNNSSHKYGKVRDLFCIVESSRKKYLNRNVQIL
ncbi:hypothetical protein WA026_006880 [Henosepilachna vigintioctopunctata]|uniref:Uncharacterized protein n=1 Tax=Henosepilachna vigintioctopunctata TaxID=420089 RepID=A0AAW1V1D6_9CUCU